MDFQFDDDDPTRCPVCGATSAEHRETQKIVNKIREEHGLPPLAAPDIRTGFQDRNSPGPGFEERP